nr:uncharacterized protein LOC127315327 [Lolium perenne]
MDARRRRGASPASGSKRSRSPDNVEDAWRLFCKRSAAGSRRAACKYDGGEFVREKLRDFTRGGRRVIVSITLLSSPSVANPYYQLSPVIRGVREHALAARHVSNTIHYSVNLSRGKAHVVAYVLFHLHCSFSLSPKSKLPFVGSLPFQSRTRNVRPRSSPLQSHGRDAQRLGAGVAGLLYARLRHLPAPARRSCWAASCGASRAAAGGGATRKLGGKEKRAGELPSPADDSCKLRHGDEVGRGGPVQVTPEPQMQCSMPSPRRSSRRTIHHLVLLGSTGRRGDRRGENRRPRRHPIWPQLPIASLPSISRPCAADGRPAVSSIGRRSDGSPTTASSCSPSSPHGCSARSPRPSSSTIPCFLQVTSLINYEADGC